jgi:hypothetical protein
VALNETPPRSPKGAAKELTAAADALDRVAGEVAGVIAKAPAALSAVLDRLPQAVISKSHTEMFANEVVAALRLAVSEARSHAAQIVSGGAQICVPSPQQPVNPPSSTIARQQVFILAPSKWTEPNGVVVTSGTHTTASPPAEIARLAIEHGHAVPAGSEFAQVLQMRQPPSYAVYSESDCVDISKPKELTKPPGAPTAALPVFHSEFARGRPRIGTATVRTSI